jgi:hypothetical protein
MERISLRDEVHENAPPDRGIRIAEKGADMPTTLDLLKRSLERVTRQLNEDRLSDEERKRFEYHKRELEKAIEDESYREGIVIDLSK